MKRDYFFDVSVVVVVVVAGAVVVVVELGDWLDGVAALGVAVVVVAGAAGVAVVVLSAAGVDGVAVVVVVVLDAGTSTFVSVLAGSFLVHPIASAATVASSKYAFIVDPVVLCGKCCKAR